LLCKVATPLANRILVGMRLAQQRYRFVQARALAAPLITAGEAPDPYHLQVEGLKLAQQLALVEANFQEAMRWGEELTQLHARQDDPERRRWAHDDPLRLWRLEFGTSPAAAERAFHLLCLPPEQALAPLLVELEREPQSTALAYALLLVLRRGGWLEWTAARPGDQLAASDLIPPRLWLLRRHGTATPTLQQRQARWQELHPGWTLQWLDPQIEAIEAMVELPELVRQSCLCVGDPAVRGDLLRLALLWLHGGVAVDFGIAPRQPLQPLLAGRELLLLQDGFGGIDTGVWAAPPRHRWVEVALMQACCNVVEGQGFSRWDLTGNFQLSGVTARWLCSQLVHQQGLRLPERSLLTHITLLAAADQSDWLQFGVAEPAPAGYVSPAEAPLIHRRRRSWLRQRWGQELPPLELAGYQPDWPA
jgi:hypothetical protein